MKDEELICEIFEMARGYDWFDLTFVDGVYQHFRDKGYITLKQRVGLENVASMLIAKEEGVYA